MAKILIIEDKRENIVFIVNNILKPLGHEVITAMDGEAGLEKALTEAPEVIITDINLPKMSGLAVLEHLQEDEVFIPAIVMTFHGTEETAIRALRAGAKEYLVKPFAFAEMEAALKKALKPDARGDGQSQRRIAELEAVLMEAQIVLEERRLELEALRQQVANPVDKLELTTMAQRAAAGDEELDRLTEVLAQTKHELSKVEKRAEALTKTITKQKTELKKYQETVQWFFSQLRKMSEMMRLLSQDMEQKNARLTMLTPEDEDKS